MGSTGKVFPFSDPSPSGAGKRNDAVPPEEEIRRLSEFFKVFGDGTRLEILFFLGDRELSVGEIAALMEMTPSAVSHQLKILKSAELVRFRREGKTLFYSLADEHVRAITEIGLEHIRE